MARQEPSNVKGKVGNVVFYDRDGIKCIRSIPETVQQTEPTIASSIVFGRAAQISKWIRRGVAPVLPNAKDQSMRLRLNTAVRHWLDLKDKNPGPELPYIDGFNFNTKTNFKERFKNKFSIQWPSHGKVVLNMDAFNPHETIMAPAYTSNVRLKIIVTSCMTQEDRMTSSIGYELDIPYIDGLVPEQNPELHFDAEPGNITVVVMALSYSILKKKYPTTVTNPAWTPADIVQGYYHM